MAVFLLFYSLPRVLVCACCLSAGETQDIDCASQPWVFDHHGTTMGSTESVAWSAGLAGGTVETERQNSAVGSNCSRIVFLYTFLLLSVCFLLSLTELMFCNEASD